MIDFHSFVFECITEILILDNCCQNLIVWYKLIDGQFSFGITKFQQVRKLKMLKKCAREYFSTMCDFCSD